MRALTLEPTSDPVWAEDEAQEEEDLRRDGSEFPSLASDVEARRTAGDVHVALPDRLIARAVAPPEGDFNHIYYLFSVPTAFSAAQGVTPRRLRLQLEFEDSNENIPPRIPIACHLDPETEVTTETIHLGELKIDFGPLQKLWPALPNVLTARTGGSLDLKKVRARVQASGLNSHQCGWRIADTEIAYDFNPSCIVQVPVDACLSVSASLHVEVWKRWAGLFHKTYLITAKPAFYLLAASAFPSSDAILERSDQEKLTYSSENNTIKVRIPSVRRAPEKSFANTRDEASQRRSQQPLCHQCGGYIKEPARPKAYADALTYCTNCLAQILGRCPSCGTSIPGLKLKPGQEARSYTDDWTIPIFCDKCHAYFPWNTREQVVYWLERFIDQIKLSGEVRLLVGYDLMLLRVNNNFNEDRQLEIWRHIRNVAPELFNGSAQGIIATLLTARMRDRLGLS